MNQSILFSDDIVWNSLTRTLTFHANQSGMLITCAIAAEKLGQLASMRVNSEEEAFEAYKKAQFDIEECAEALIEDEDFDEQGNIKVG
ncbi:DUF1488 family protein [Vibrio methylphosphonaticus]|uniref:DUF1488 domain-containing protein n=1 Tax=Vibrio methylphosphonaticus TaxID=2946866 RepID=UPI002029D6B8|nr:DUF1488 domain-containing protein [Vibrio methylphosphonaticus]MCL9776963.1 DUF1488 domain-containing protein [Vibrio methylphosphonaticus]